MELGRKLNAKKIEAWLERSLVPVEPNPGFVRELRGRLVVLRGSRMPSPLIVVLVLSALLIILVTWFGLGMRLVLTLLGLIGLIERRRRSPEVLSEARAGQQ